MLKATKYKSGYDYNSTYFENNLNFKDIPSIFIHGVGLDVSMWSKQKNYFKKNTLYYDLLNHGNTKKKIKIIKYSDFNFQLKELINFFNLKKVNLIGFSIGGIIALNFSSNYKKLVNKLVLISTVHNRSNEQKKLVLSRYKQAIEGKSISNLAINRWFSKEYLKKKPIVYKNFFNLLEKNKKTDFLPVYKIFANTNKLKIDFKKFNIPTLIITGQNDLNSTPIMSNKLSKKIKNSKLKIIPEGKHMAIYEKSNLVNLEIKSFLK